MKSWMRYISSKNSHEKVIQRWREYGRQKDFGVFVLVSNAHVKRTPILGKP